MIAAPIPKSPTQAAFRWSLTLPLTLTRAALRRPASSPTSPVYLTAGTVSAGASRPNSASDLNLPGKYGSRWPNHQSTARPSSTNRRAVPAESHASSSANAMTSRMLSAPVTSMTKRSKPMATPQVGGMSAKAASNFSSMG